MNGMLDLERIRRAQVSDKPFAHFIVEGAIPLGDARRSAEAFPAIGEPGAKRVEETRFGPPFEELLDELKGDALRNIIAEKLGIDLTNSDIVIKVRSQSRLTDGNIHTDTPEKLVTVLLYFNEPGEAGESNLRILKNGRNLDDFIAEIPPNLGNMVVFKVTPDCWHGHKPMIGKRLSLQMNYLSGVKTHGKHQLARRLISRTRRKFGRLAGQA
jgi:SM-20-related protein